MKAGFWIRLKAIWIDTLIIIIGIKILFFFLFLQPYEIYVPFEITTMIAGIVYSSIFIASRGYTLGKKICGLIVLGKDDKPLAIFTVVLRESISKIISTIVLLLGFFWIGITKSKRGWHDYLVGSKVIQTSKQNRKMAIVSFTLPLLITVFLLHEQIVDGFTLFPKAIAMKLSPLPESFYNNRDKSGLIEVSSLGPLDDSLFLDWLNQNAKSPEEYLIESASKNQITLLGEMHDNKENLDFLNKIIPDLYHKAGVRCIAMECFPIEMNNKVQKLINGKEYDIERALEVARSSPWKLWGSKGYWDVFETVWKLNKTLSDKNEKMRVIGIDTKWDGPSIALMGVGDNPLASPFWEKLRIFGILDDFMKLILRDEIMAINIENELIKKELKSIVLIGTAHSNTHYAQQLYIMGTNKIICRMGCLLHRKYGNKIFQIRLHQWFLSPTFNVEGPLIGEFLERIMDKRSNTPAGFNVENSPFANLRDTNTVYFYNQPKVNFNDIASGYIYLRPNRESNKCKWMEGYISKEMFMGNKVFYELFFQSKMQDKADSIIVFGDSKELDQFLLNIWDK
jgi:uncharacterized RDD family membrane protein YckC